MNDTAVAVEALIGLERKQLPPIILEPCCADGTGFVEPLQKAAYEVIARDIDPDFGFPVADFLTDPLPVSLASTARTG